MPTRLARQAAWRGARPAVQQRGGERLAVGHVLDKRAIRHAARRLLSSLIRPRQRRQQSAAATTRAQWRGAAQWRYRSRGENKRASAR